MLYKYAMFNHARNSFFLLNVAILPRETRASLKFTLRRPGTNVLSRQKISTRSTRALSLFCEIIRAVDAPISLSRTVARTRITRHRGSKQTREPIRSRTLDFTWTSNLLPLRYRATKLCSVKRTRALKILLLVKVEEDARCR